MKPIKYLSGDATRPLGEGNKIIAHLCNDIGNWGKGFVLALSKQSKLPEQSFRQWYSGRDTNDFALGAVQFVSIAPQVWAANMVGQHRVKVKRDDGTAPIRYQAIEQALAKVAQKALELDATVHMPRIGCGLAGGDWKLIEPIINKQLSALDIEVMVYDWK